MRRAAAPVTTVDSTGSVGSHTSMAIGSDGFPVIVYYGTANADLMVTGIA
ncbi:hypothetical protein HQ535_11730 [bacterium]|nr:hypothetical protein [bacterium]